MKRSRFTKLLVPVVCVLLFTALGGSAASAAAKGTDRPWKGSGLVTGTFTVGPAGVQVIGVGTVTVTHLGRSDYSNVVTCPTGCINGGTTKVIIVAANGDMVFGEGVVAPNNGGTTVELVGGTGRFANATGNYVVAGTAVFTSPTTFTLYFTQTGTVSY